MKKNILTEAQQKELAEAKKYDDLREGGFEVQEFTHKGITIVIRADFPELKKAYSKTFDIETDKKQDVKVNSDMIAPGDYLIKFRTILGRELIIDSPLKRLAFAQKITQWLLSELGEDEEKKS